MAAAQHQSIVDTCREVAAAEHGLSLRAVCLLAPRSIAKTTSGKIARAWCRKGFQEGTLQVVFRSDSVPPASPAGEEVPQAVGGVMGYSPLPGEIEEPVEEGGESEQKKSKSRVQSVEALIPQLEAALLQICAQGPSEVNAPVDRDAALLSLGLDSMTIVQFKGVLEHRCTSSSGDIQRLSVVWSLSGLNATSRTSSSSPIWRLSTSWRSLCRRAL